MPIAWSDVQAACLGDAKIQGQANGAVFVSMAYAELNAGQWGTMLDTAALYLAAHKFTIGSRSGGYGGPTSGERVGQASRSSTAKVTDYLDTTPYGKELRRLMMAQGLNFRVLVSGGPSSIPPGFIGGGNGGLL